MRRDVMVFAIGTIAVFLMSPDFSRKDAPVSKPQTPDPERPGGRVDSSLDRLVPAFRIKVLQLMVRMRERGFRPVVFETYRSPARAAALAKKGTGVAQSQHTLGLAVDIIDQGKGFAAPQAFWDALHSEALALGLGRVQRKDTTGRLVWDWPHVQAMPGRYDATMRAMASADARDAYLRDRYA